MVDIVLIQQYYDSNIRKFLMKLELCIVLKFFLASNDYELSYTFF